MNKFTKGFTLIELLVVISIIGLLSSVILASLNTARTKGSDASIKSQLASMRHQAELIYDSGNSYGTAYATGTCPVASGLSLFGTTSPVNMFLMVSGVVNSAGASLTRCASTGNAWVMSAQLKTGGTAGDTTPDAWCVDSIGKSKSYTYATGQTIAHTIATSTACN